MGYYGNSQPNFAGVGKPYNAADILASVNAISGSLTNQSDLMAKDRKAQQMSEANAYVSGLLGKGDRASILAAQSMLPYANERYGKQADNIMADIRQAESLKQARDIADNELALNGQKLSNDYEYNNKKLAQDLLIADRDNATKLQVANIGARASRASQGKGLTPAQQLAFQEKMTTPTLIKWRDSKGVEKFSTVPYSQVLDYQEANRTGGVIQRDGKKFVIPNFGSLLAVGDEARALRATEMKPAERAKYERETAKDLHNRGGVVDKFFDYMGGY